MTLLSDRSLSIQTILGRNIFTFPIDDIWMNGQDDEIVSMAVPPVAGDPFISLLTKKGHLLILHYDVVQSVQDYKLHLIWLNREFDQDLSLICKEPEFCARVKEMTNEQIDQEALNFNSKPYVVMKNIEKIDLPFIIANETRVVTGPFDPEAGVEFKHVALIQNHGQKYFVVSDSEGYLS